MTRWCSQPSQTSPVYRAVVCDIGGNVRLYENGSDWRSSHGRSEVL